MTIYAQSTTLQFWNTKLAPPPRKASKDPDAPTNGDPSNSDASDNEKLPSARAREDYQLQEAQETPVSLRDKQKAMEERVYRIWTVLSTFEESSAACISEMLRHVSNGHYINGVRMAEKFVLHVETLFCAMDDLLIHFRRAGAKGIHTCDTSVSSSDQAHYRYFSRSRGPNAL